MRRFVLFAMSIVLVAAGARAQAQEQVPPASPARLFEAGKYDEAAGQVRQRLEAGEVPAGDLFWAAQALVRAGRGGEAVALFERLGGGEDDPWTEVRQSGVQLVNGNSEGALHHGTRATQLAPDLFYGHYQLGLALHERQQWAAASAAFSRASELDGGAAYAHYYAGVAYNRLKRIDSMVVHFKRFLDLAPDAPERDQVEQLLKLLRGIR